MRIAAEWSGHPHRFVVEPTEDFLNKAAQDALTSQRRGPGMLPPPRSDGSSGTTERARSPGPDFSVIRLVH